MRRPPSLLKWFCISTCAAATQAVVVFYGICHGGLGIPLRDVLQPCLLIAGLTVAAAVPFRWAYRRLFASRNPMPIYIVVGGYTLAVLLLYVRFGLRVGMLPAANGHEYYFFVLVFLPCSWLLAVWLSRRWRAGSWEDSRPK